MKQGMAVLAAVDTRAGVVLDGRVGSEVLVVEVAKAAVAARSFRTVVSAALSAALSVMVFASTSAYAADAANTVDAARATMLTNSNACMGCHTIKRKMVGPSFDDVTARYKADPAAVDKLAAKIIKGGAGVWGMIPMPSHPAMSKTDAQTIATWIMAGSPPAK